MGTINNDNRSDEKEILFSKVAHDVDKIEMTNSGNKSSGSEGDKKLETPSLLSRCLPFIIDENGVNVSENTPPAYTLDSVEDIIKGFETEADKKISGLYSDNPTPDSKEKTILFEGPKHSNEKDLLKELTKRLNEARAFSEIETPQIKPETTEKNEIKTYQSNVDDTRIISGKVINSKSANVLESTRQFTAIDPKTLTNTVNNDDLSNTRTIDTPVLNDVPPSEKKFSPLSREQSDNYDDFIDDMNGYTNVSDAKKFGGRYIRQKKFALFSMISSGLIAAILIFLKTPLLSSFWTNNTITVFALSLCLLIISSIINLRVFKNLFSFFGGALSSELPVSICVIAVIIHSVTAIFSKAPISSEILCDVAAISLFFSALAEYIRCSYTLSNFKLIANSKDKYGFSLIKDDDAEFISSGAIDGDVMLGGAKKCTNILGFIRSSESFDAAARIVTIASLISVVVSFICGIVAAIIVDASFGFNILIAVLCIACLPATMLISILPMNKLSRTLKRYRAQVPGYVNAGRIEQINSIAVNSSMLFPEGSVELTNMKVVGNSSIDSILIDCAALTTAIGSPLAPIFCDIASTRGAKTELPLADSYKYEEKMGVSGWIDNRHLFIGNRTLLEAHGMKAAPIEVDRKILKGGNFPVYIAADGKVEALLVVKYTPKARIKYELCRACNTGITILIDNTDPNITKDMVCDYFGLYDDLVKIMPSKAAAVYNKLISREESTFANASFYGDICGLLRIATSCIRLKTMLTLLLVSGIVIEFASLAAGIYIMFASSSILSTLYFYIYQFASSAILFILSLIYKP